MIRILSVLWAIVMCTALAAQSLSERDQQQVEGLAMMFDAAFAANDMAAVIGFLPQPVVEHIANQNDMRPAVLRRALVLQTQQMMEGVTVERFEMDVENLVPGLTPTNRPYALVPTVSVLTVNGASFETETQTLFFEDNDAWFLLRLENANQLDILKAVYPDFANLTLP